jgi:hypothetical protein
MIDGGRDAGHHSTMGRISRWLAVCLALAAFGCSCEAETDTPGSGDLHATVCCRLGCGRHLPARLEPLHVCSAGQIDGSRAWVGGGQASCNVAFQRARGVLLEFDSIPVRDSSDAYRGLEWGIVSLLPRAALRDEVGWWRSCETDGGHLELGHHCGRHDPSVKLFPYWRIHRTAP